MTSRFTQFVEKFDLDLRDFTFDDNGEVILTDSGLEKVSDQHRRLTCSDAEVIGMDPWAGYSDAPRGLE